MWGDSAGAHLATTAALAASAPDPDPWLLGEWGIGLGRADVRAIVYWHVYWHGTSELRALPDRQESR